MIRIDILYPQTMNSEVDKIIKKYDAEDYAGASQAFTSEKFGIFGCGNGYESCILVPEGYVDRFIKEASDIFGGDCVHNTDLWYEARDEYDRRIKRIKGESNGSKISSGF